MKRFIFVLFFVLLFFTPPVSFAKTELRCCMDYSNFQTYPSCVGKDNVKEVTCIPDFFPPARYFGNLSSIFNILLPNLVLIAGIILFLLVIVAGFQMITSAGSGDAKATEKWRNMLMYGIVGFLIVLFAYGIMQLVEYFTGATILNPEEIIK